MWSVNRPHRSALDAFSVSISRVRNPDLRTRLSASSASIVNSANLYSQTATAQTLHTFPEQQIVGLVTGDELIKNYTQRFAGKKGPARHIYNEIISLPAGDRCPYCDQRDVSTLDHVLPKAHYPVLSVTPDNLVGSCSECNKKKDDTRPALAVETFLHPYFENISGQRWLMAEVIEIQPCAIVFFATPPLPPVWSIELADRLQRQFTLLELAKLYSSQAGREISDIRAGLSKHFDAGGEIAVRRELTHQWDSRLQNQLNSWKTALYEALKDSDWYCSGGFRSE